MKTKSFPYTLNPDEIPTAKLVCLRSGRVEYACPQACWSEHLDAWSRAMSNGNKLAPEPMPYGHLCFEKPEHYGFVRYGDNSEQSKRKALEHIVRADLSGGWCKPGAQLEQIVKATVDAKMQGIDTGAAHFFAAVQTWL